MGEAFQCLCNNGYSGNQCETGEQVYSGPFQTATFKFGFVFEHVAGTVAKSIEFQNTILDKLVALQVARHEVQSIHLMPGSVLVIVTASPTAIAVATAAVATQTFVVNGVLATLHQSPTETDSNTGSSNEASSVPVIMVGVICALLVLVVIVLVVKRRTNTVLDSQSGQMPVLTNPDADHQVRGAHRATMYSNPVYHPGEKPAPAVDREHGYIDVNRSHQYGWDEQNA